ncbi:transposase domain-containing protein [Serratia quinivorans]
MESARINGLNLYDYLHALLTALKLPGEEINRDALLPWKLTLS